MPPKVHPLEDIIEKCLLFEADGANAIYLMATATFKFADFLKVGKEVKAALKPETPLIANVGDFNVDEARALREAGFTGIYHAMRLGEGITTAIDPKVRLKTMDAAQKAGLLIGTCLEPFGRNIRWRISGKNDPDQRNKGRVQRRRAAHKPAGIALAAHGSLNYGKMAHILAAVRLATGYSMIGNCTHEPTGWAQWRGQTCSGPNWARIRAIRKRRRKEAGRSNARSRSWKRPAGRFLRDLRSCTAANKLGRLLSVC
jgi:biotin synthase